MFHTAIISGSVRIGRERHKVSKYFERYIREKELATVEIFDLKVFNFPVEEERLQNLPALAEVAKMFSEKIKAANAVIVVNLNIMELSCKHKECHRSFG